MKLGHLTFGQLLKKHVVMMRRNKRMTYVIYKDGMKVRTTDSLTHARGIVRHIKGAVVKGAGVETVVPPTKWHKLHN